MAPVVKQETADPTATPGSSSRLTRADTDYQVADPGAGAYDDQGMAEYGDEYGYEDEMEYGEGVDPGQAKGKQYTAANFTCKPMLGQRQTVTVENNCLCLSCER